MSVPGRIERVPLRTAWRHEAYDFTTWLADNIDVLNEVIDVPLVSAEREQAAGAFSVDLVAEDRSGDTVVIENQLERSDHDHLGKLITYLSMYDAAKAIWIVAEPRPEHVTAVTWLNQSSAEFYLLKAEAIQIGGSPPALLLTRIVGPSAEARQVGVQKKELGERHELRYRFWQQLLETAREHTRLHANVSPTNDTWVAAGSGRSGITFNYVIWQHKSAVELYIDQGEVQRNSQVFEALVEDRERIEAEFGGVLDWQALEGKRACRVRATVASEGYRDPEGVWPGTQRALAEAMARFESALKARIQALPR